MGQATARALVEYEREALGVSQDGRLFSNGVPRHFQRYSSAPISDYNPGPLEPENTSPSPLRGANLEPTAVPVIDENNLAASNSSSPLVEVESKKRTQKRPTEAELALQEAIRAASDPTAPPYIPTAASASASALYPQLDDSPPTPEHGGLKVDKPTMPLISVPVGIERDADDESDATAASRADQFLDVDGNWNGQFEEVTSDAIRQYFAPSPEPTDTCRAEQPLVAGSAMTDRRFRHEMLDSSGDVTDVLPLYPTRDYEELDAWNEPQNQRPAAAAQSGSEMSSGYFSAVRPRPPPSAMLNSSILTDLPQHTTIILMMNSGANEQAARNISVKEFAELFPALNSGNVSVQMQPGLAPVALPAQPSSAFAEPIVSPSAPPPPGPPPPPPPGPPPPPIGGNRGVPKVRTAGTDGVPAPTASNDQQPSAAAPAPPNNAPVSMATLRQTTSTALMNLLNQLDYSAEDIGAVHKNLMKHCSNKIEFLELLAVACTPNYSNLFQAKPLLESVKLMMFAIQQWHRFLKDEEQALRDEAAAHPPEDVLGKPKLLNDAIEKMYREARFEMRNSSNRKAIRDAIESKRKLFVLWKVKRNDERAKQKQNDAKKDMMSELKGKISARGQSEKPKLNFDNVDDDDDSDFDDDDDEDDDDGSVAASSVPPDQE